MNESMKNNITALLDKSARLAGQRVEGARLGDVDRLLDQLDEGQSAPGLFAEVWQAAGLDGVPARLHPPMTSDLPFAVYKQNAGWALIQTRGADGVWHGEGMDGTVLSLASFEDAECISLPRRSGIIRSVPSAIRLVWDAIWARKSVFVDAILATALVALLALATSLYAMQIFDRVIPNQGFQTLWVLTVGVTLSIGLEFLLKQVRSYTVDKTCNAIDHQLSEWFFNRMLGIRMEARPASVGTLASQIKGFEMVRGVLASTSLFVVADVPFALFFIVVIALIGGWVVAVPLIALPIALVTGLMFQGAIQIGRASCRERV